MGSTAGTSARAVFEWDGDLSRKDSSEKHGSNNGVDGQLVATNADAAGPLLAYVEQASDAALLLQEHKSDRAMLPKLQSQLKGIADRTEADGLSAGVAVLVPTYMMITAPPLLSSGERFPARAVAAQVNWGCRGGVVLVSLYLKDSVGLDTFNMSVLYQLATYLGRLNPLDRPW
eukprot:4172508-Pyramimonas_sp.AAC.1